MPIDLDQDLVNAAILEYHAAKDHGREDGAAWTAAVARIRHDVLHLAAVTCHQVALATAEDEPHAAGARACAAALQEMM